MPRPAGAEKAIELWKRTVPPRGQQWVIEARLVGRRLVESHRPVPDFLVIGAQRCGTSSLYKWLEAHPAVVSSLRKETEFLSGRWCRGEEWYRAHFASNVRRSLELKVRGRRIQTFEASPNYLFHPAAPSRAAALVPGARLVALLRDPVDRALSHYRHEVRAGREPLSFEEALDREDERLCGEEERMAADPCYRSLAWERYSYAARGRYYGQLERWIDAFGRDRLLVLMSQDLYAEPRSTFATLLEFLGLPPWFPSSFANHSYASTLRPDPGGMTEAARKRLSDHFAPHNEHLSTLLGRPLGWA